MSLGSLGSPGGLEGLGFLRVSEATYISLGFHQEKYFFPWQTRKSGGHPPQSSGISGDLGLHEVYQGAQALQGTPGLPRVTEAP